MLVVLSAGYFSGSVVAAFAEILQSQQAERRQRKSTSGLGSRYCFNEPAGKSFRIQ